MWLRGWLVLVLVWCISAVPARAQDTGSVSGAVFDQTGNVIADAGVRISGDQMPAGRTVRTDASGLYNFQRLLPGKVHRRSREIGHRQSFASD